MFVTVLFMHTDGQKTRLIDSTLDEQFKTTV